MTDPFTSATLSIVPTTPIAVATNEATMAILTGPALRMLIAERLEQVERHGHHPDDDLNYDEAELALAAKAYLDTYIDLALRPGEKPASRPESWPWADLFWKEPTPDQAAKALTKALALGLAELDRILAVMDLLHAARPLIPTESVAETPLHTLDWHG